MVLTGWYPSQLEPGNGDFVKEQLRLLRKYGLPVDFIFADLNVAYLKSGQFYTRQFISQDANGNTDLIITGPTWPKNNIWGLKSWIQKYCNLVADYFSKYTKPDIIHAHTYLGAIVAARVSQEFDIPFIATEHFTGWMDDTIRPWHKRMGIIAFQKAVQVTAVSSALKKAIQPHLRNEIRVLPNFTDTDQFTIGNKKDDGIIRLISIGELIERKQVDHAIRTLQILIDQKMKAQLTIVGDGPLAPRLRSLAEEFNVADRIIWTARISPDEVAQRLCMSNALLHTSRLETFGLVLAEALCCGVQVFSYDNRAIQDMRHLPGLHVCEEPAPESLARLLKHSLLISTKIQPVTIRDSAIEAFGYRSIIPQWIECYEMS